jgi:spermidine dehydrogenase
MPQQPKRGKRTEVDPRDSELGMHRRITRRDFLNGVGIAIGGSVLASSVGQVPVLAGNHSGAPYPPSFTGMRGSYDATYTVAHSLRDGTFWESADKAEDTGETYDLIVVGAGISGLSAAYFFRKATTPKARILILDNHDDFGGHAKRNEFRVGKRVLLSNGGTQSIENPSAYSAVAKELLTELGIDTQRFYRAYDQKLYSQLGTACFFDRETFGEDRVVPGMGSVPWPDFLRNSPLPEKVRQDIARLYTEKVDYLPGLSREEKRARLGKISYADFLTKICKADPAVLPFFQTYSHDLFTVGIDAISALTCYQSGDDDYGAISYPGFQGMDLGQREKEEPYIFHFPDGNASIARLLVRSLIPQAIPGHTMEDVVMAHADYSRFDQPQSSVRIRLNSTVVKAQHSGEPESAKQVEVSYVREGKLQSAKATNCILACYNGMVPYLCPELPEKQKEALHYGVKQPLIYTHVAIRSWSAFQKLGVRQIVSPGSYHCLTMLDFPVSLGQYRFPSSPDEPMVLFMLRAPCKPGLPRRDQYRMGRFELLGTPFSTFERNIRDQLQRMLAAAGFDSARDIAAITVNRWAHGYAYDYDPLSDPDYAADERPCVVGRKQLGRISIANSDAGARALTDEAIDQAYRAVQEQTKSLAPQRAQRNAKGEKKYQGHA